MAKKKTEKKSKDNGVLSAADLRGKTPDQLNELVAQFKKEQFNLRFRKITGEAAKPSVKRQIKLNVARVKTVQNEQRKVEAKNA